MIEGLRPYPEMADTGQPWLPVIPAHWEIRRNGRLFSERRETGYPELPILEVSLRSGVRIRDMENGKRKQQIADRSIYQRAVKGDIAYNMMRMWQGAVGVAPADGLVSPAYVVAKAHQDVEAAYYAYLFRTDDYMKEIDSYSRGIVPDRNRLYWQAFKQMPSAYPPLDEQRLIVRFLDWHGAMTSKLIRAKRRLIALLNEQKQSIIHRAVTRGLDPAAKLKPSGVDWLGDVPEHWEVKPLKWWSDINRVTLGQNTPDDFAFDYIDIGSVGTGMLNAPLERITFATSPSRARRVVRFGDTIISTVRTYLKAIWFVDQDRADLIASTGFAVLTPHEQVSPRFFAFALQSAAFINLVISRSDGVAYPAINETRLGSLKLALPPSISEQDAIIAHLDTATVAYDAAIASAQNEIALIQEFRTRLIADVVTGQLDVRAAAANLPDVTESDAFGDASDDMEDDDEAALDPETEDA
jgi:type I restriction enzyme S subunit